MRRAIARRVTTGTSRWVAAAARAAAPRAYQGRRLISPPGCHRRRLSGYRRRGRLLVGRSLIGSDGRRSLMMGYEIGSAALLVGRIPVDRRPRGGGGDE